MSTVAVRARHLTAVKPDNENLLASIDQQLAEAKEARRTLDAEYRQERTKIDGSIRSLETARRDLVKPPPKKKRAKRLRSAPLNAAAQAGKANIEKVRTAARTKRQATQAELADASGVGTGSMTWAIRALEEAGEIRATGNRINGSREFVYVPKKARTLKPGEGS